MSRQLIDAEAMTKILPLPKSAIYRLAREDKVPHVQVGRYVFFDPEAIDRWIEAGGTEAGE